MLNTPTSELVAEIVPVKAARTSSHGELAIAKSAPPAVMSAAMVMTVRRRPNRSAASDHTIVIGAVTDGDVLRAGEMLIERDLGWEYGG